MRTLDLFVLGVAFSTCAITASAQQPPAQQPAQQPPAQELTVIAPNVTDTTLGPRTLTPSIVSCTDLPTATVPTSPLRVVASHSGGLHQIYGTGEIVVLNGGTPQGLMVGQRYFIRHLQLGLTAEQPSVATPAPIRTAGWLTVIAADERFALARIDFACDAVEAGDYLDAFVEPVLPSHVPADGPANFNEMARVLFGTDRKQTFGAGDITNIDRGKSSGIGKGTRVAFYRDRQNGTPLVELGAGIVLDITDTSAKVVLVRAREAIMTGDYVAIRGTAVAPQ
jgi:hypothetical protein